MKIYATNPEDNKNGIMRVEFDGADVELLEELVDRLDKLAGIERILEIVAVESPFILGSDIPYRTQEGADFLGKIVKGWDAEDDIVVKLDEFDEPDEIALKAEEIKIERALEEGKSG